MAVSRMMHGFARIIHARPTKYLCSQDSTPDSKPDTLCLTMLASFLA